MDRDETKNADIVRLVVMSDTHGEHRSLHVPDGDFLIHAGDFTLFNRSRDSVRDFNQWLFELPHGRKLVIPGNHDFKFADPRWRSLISAATLLLNEGVSIDGIRIWASSVTKSNLKSFGAENDDGCRRIFWRIPRGTDVIVTHSPPLGILDVSGVQHRGCSHLLREIGRVRPALHVFGHIHQSYGTTRIGRTLFVNAALAGPNYQLVQLPIVVDYDRQTHCARGTIISSRKPGKQKV
jgi:Icc-related predicted phosphoesterase